MRDGNEIELTAPEFEMEARLRELAPLMREASRAQPDEPDLAFVSALRARLVEPLPAVPRPSFQRQLRRRLAHRYRFVPRWVPATAGALAILVVAIGLFAALHSSAGPTKVASTMPRPTRADLIRTYPFLNIRPLGGGGGGFSPTTSPLGEPTGDAYPARLSLHAGTFPPMPRVLPAYKLASRHVTNRTLIRTARRLGINTREIYCMNPSGTAVEPCRHGAWTVVQVRGWPLHSLNVSSQGEIIFHDVPRKQFAYRGPRLSFSAAVGIARHWLTVVGLPARGMPVLTIGRTPDKGTVNSRLVAVSFGWVNGARANVPAATMWVAPAGHVQEALAWGPIAPSISVKAVGVASAWDEVQTGKAPIAVEGRPLSFPHGNGSFSTVRVSHVLVVPKYGAAYLEPVYQFSGLVTLGDGQGRHAWYALVPAAGRF